MGGRRLSGRSLQTVGPGCSLWKIHQLLWVSSCSVRKLNQPIRPDRAFTITTQDQDRYSLLRRAIQTHTTLTREGATGKGIDRHLLGLRLMMQPGEKCELFEDELFTESQTWKLSTSGLSAGYLFRGTGYVYLVTSLKSSVVRD